MPDPQATLDEFDEICSDSCKYIKPMLKVCIIYRVPFVVKFMFSLTNIVSVTPDTPTD